MTSLIPAHRGRAAAKRAAQWSAAQRRRVTGTVHAFWNDPRRRTRFLRTAAIASICALIIGAFFAVFDWDWMRGPIASYASSRTGRVVHISGHLRVHLLTLTPSATIDGLTIGNPAWMGPGHTADLGRTTVTVKLLPLLVGRVTLPLVDIERPTLTLYRDRSGRDNWTFGKPTGKPSSLPPIQHFILRDGSLKLVDDQRRLSFTGLVSTREHAGAGAAAFELDGQGVLNGEAFLARATGGPLINVKRDKPYPFSADIRTGPTRVTLQGSIAKPFDFGGVQGALTAAGPDLADLYDLTGVVFPNSPPYRLSGEFTRNGQAYAIHRLNGRVGESDLHGEVSMRAGPGRRFLQADLGSSVLKFTDLSTMFGGSPGSGAKVVASPAQKLIARRMAAQRRLLPDATLEGDRLRSMDADVRYHADRVAWAALPLRQASVHAILDHGVLKLDPIALGLLHGQVHGRAQIDARTSTPVSDVDLSVSNVRLEDVVNPGAGAPPLEGALQARARLHGRGDSVHKAAAASDGEFAVAVPGGRIRRSFAELLGVNVVPGLFQLLAKDPKQTDLRCAVADFDVRHGVLQARQITLDTGVVVATGSGTVDLGTEAIDLTITGKSKKFRLVRAIAPFHVRGRLAAPKLSVDSGKAVAQLGAGVALGALLSPLAVALPFLSLGGGHNADCGALMADAKAKGAPVKAIGRQAAFDTPRRATR